jgi:hypothetical protein
MSRELPIYLSGLSGKSRSGRSALDVASQARITSKSFQQVWLSEITVGATVIALFPLASHGGPLWQPMCYAQIGGLSVATFITLLLVPVIYAIFVLDLKLVKWETSEATGVAHIWRHSRDPVYLAEDNYDNPGGET